MMRRDVKYALAALVGLVAAPALAQQAASQSATLQVTPNQTLAAPGPSARGFDAPKPALTLQAPGDPAAVRGLAPGQDLIGDAGPAAGRASAADTDTYFASQEYQ